MIDKITPQSVITDLKDNSICVDGQLVQIDRPVQFTPDTRNSFRGEIEICISGTVYVFEGYLNYVPQGRRDFDPKPRFAVQPNTTG